MMVGLTKLKPRCFRFLLIVFDSLVGWQLGHRLPRILHRFSVYEALDSGVKAAKLFLNLRKGLGILDR